MENRNHLFSTRLWDVFLFDDQTYLGRVKVVLKRSPCESLSDVTVEEWVDFGELTKSYESAVKRAFGATMFNWSCLMNNAAGEGRPTHVHWHVKPRYLAPVTVGGETFVDEAFGKHYLQGTSRMVSDEVRDEIIRRYRLYGN